MSKTIIEIRSVKTDMEREQVFNLRYKVYVKELGYKQIYADHKHKRIEEPLDESAKILAAFCNGEVVGTLRVNLARDSELAYYPQLYQMSESGEAHPLHTSISTKLIVQESFRGKGLRNKGIALQLYQCSYHYLLTNKVKFDFIDCDFQMISFFEKLGYRHSKTGLHPEYGKGMILTLDVQDLEYLEGIQSPLKGICRQFSEDQKELLQLSINAKS